MQELYKLVAKNYRGQSFTRELRRLNVVTGPNGAGKTTLRLLIQEALSNQTEDAKTARELYENYGDGANGYTIGFEGNDLAILRKVILDKKGSISCKVTINGKESSDKAAVALLASETMDAEDFYIGNFVNLSDDKQKTILLSLLSKKHDITAKKAVLLEEIETASIKKELQEANANSWIDYLINAMAMAKQTRSALQADKQKMSKATEAAVDMRTDKSPHNYQALQNERENLLKEKQEIEKAVSKEEGKREAFRKTQARIKELEQKIGEYQKALKDLEENFKKSQPCEEETQALATEKSQLQIRLEYLNQMLVAFGEEKACPFATGADITCPVDIEAKIKEMEAEQETGQSRLLAITKEMKILMENAKIQTAKAREIDQLKAKIEEATEGRLASEKALDGLDMGQDTASQQMQKDNIDKKLAEIDANTKDAKDAENAARLIAEAQSRKETIEAEWNTSKTDIDRIAIEIQNHLREVISPLEDSINGLLLQIRPSYRIRFFDSEGNYRPRCRNRQGKWASLKAISGGEKASYYPAILKAMYELKNPKFSVLLCENSEIDGDNMINFLNGIQQNATDIDLVVVNSWYDDFTAPEGWNHLKLEVQENLEVTVDPESNQKPLPDFDGEQELEAEGSGELF